METQPRRWNARLALRIEIALLVGLLLGWGAWLLSHRGSGSSESRRAEERKLATESMPTAPDPNVAQLPAADPIVGKESGAAQPRGDADESDPTDFVIPDSFAVSDHAETSDYSMAKGLAVEQWSGSSSTSGQRQFDTIGTGAGSGRRGRGAFAGRNDSKVVPIGTVKSIRGESYDSPPEQPFRNVGDAPLSTFSVDVDTASYANVRRFLAGSELPPAAAVRVEELLNYFPYADPGPKGEESLGVHVESGACPWEPSHRLARIALRARAIPNDQRKPSHFVFLIDVSGSMSADNKLPLLKRSLRLLVSQLTENDWVSIVTYAGESGLALAPTNGSDKNRILEAIERLEAGGSTNGGAGIQLAYETALSHKIENGNHRVILATDGDFNVGVTDPDALVKLVEEKAKSGVFLTVLGFGMGNLKDSTMEKLADKGNGNYAYVDGIAEARKVLVDQLSGTLVTVAKDVKIQVEFNPARAESYRLLGYANRALAARDFNDDRKDAGDVGAGHSVVALYEIVPTDPGAAGDERPAVDPLKYQRPKPAPPAGGASAELLTVKVRFKEPTGERSRLLEFPYQEKGAAPSEDFRFSAAVAAFGLVLGESPHKGGATLDLAAELAASAVTFDPNGYRREFLGLAEKANDLRKRTAMGTR